MKNINSNIHKLRRSRPSHIGVRWTVIAVLALFLTTLLPGPVFAISPEQRKLYNNDIRYYDIAEDQLACGAGGVGGTAANLTVGKDFSLGTGDVIRRVNLMKALVADLGLTAEQAAGIVGNFMWESGGVGVPPNVNETTPKIGPPNFRGGYGWAQWTGSRQTSFIDFAVQNGYMASKTVDATDAANYAYLKDELSKGYAKTITLLKTTTTPADAARAFESTYESAGVPAIATRQGYAQQVFNEYNGGDAGSANATPTRGAEATNAANAPAAAPTAPATSCPTPGAEVSGTAACGDAVSCAKAILAKGAAGGFVIRAGAQQNLETIAAGQQLTVCPGAPVLLNVTLMQLLLTLSNTYKIDIHNFTAPGHNCDQFFHPKGRATDVNIAGVPADCASLGSNPQNRAFAQAVMDGLPQGGGLGQKQCIGALNNTAGKRYFDDGDQHFHIDVGANVP